jgi:predicted membrane channel-forming protein YqfA (hemolysin III family)
MILIPFSISALTISVAFIISKLQNHNTYLAGAIYALLGILEIGVIVNCLIKYLNEKSTPQLLLIVISVSLGILFLINLISLIFITPWIHSDSKFARWISHLSKNE